MRVLIAGLALFATTPVRAELVEASPLPRQQDGPSTSSGRTEKETPDQVARRYGLAGEVLIARGDKVLLDQGYGPIAPSGGAKHRPRERWRLASITKQVTAALIVKSGIGLDSSEGLQQPIGLRIEPFQPYKLLTLRQLLTHHTGLANPDDTTAGKDEVPQFYRGALPDTLFCQSKPPNPGAAFAYNNCDYINAANYIGGFKGWPAR